MSYSVDIGCSKSNEDIRQCRICLEDLNDSKLEYVSPCKCSGTQKYVHKACLHKWQSTLQRKGEYGRVRRCPVCLSQLSVPPPVLCIPVRVRIAARLLTTVLVCVALSFMLAASKQWIVLFSLVCLILAVRSQWTAILPFLMCFMLCVMLVQRGLRLQLRCDPDGRLVLALIRQGQQLPLLTPGTILVAANNLTMSDVFRESIILITDHNASGTRGLIVNKPLEPGYPPLIPGMHESDIYSDGTLLRWGDHVSETGDWDEHQQILDKNLQDINSAMQWEVKVKHFWGGPLRLPNQDGMFLHNIPTAPNVVELVSHSTKYARRSRLLSTPYTYSFLQPTQAYEYTQHPANDERVQIYLNSEVSVFHSPQNSIYMGGDLQMLLEDGNVRGLAFGESNSFVNVYKGMCAWSDGQLESEVRRGLWGVKKAEVSDIMIATKLSTRESWQILSAQPDIWWPGNKERKRIFFQPTKIEK